MKTSLALNPETAPDDPLLLFNRILEEQSAPARLNESFLLDKLRELELHEGWNPPVFWLSMARLTELALVCAGNYADAAEYEAVGDLLVNPRRILVHVAGRSEPLTKKRHTPLTEQFRDKAGDRARVIFWLKKETALEIKEAPLLPVLYQRLQSSGFLAASHLDEVKTRMKRIADTVGFVAAAPCPPHLDFSRFVYQLSDRDRDIVETGLCRFDRRRFDELGREITRLLSFPHYQGGYLCPDPPAGGASG